MSQPIRITLDGDEIEVAPDLPLTSILMERAPGWRESPRLQARRGMFCGMGLCFECVVEVDGQWTRACMERSRSGMEIRTADQRRSAGGGHV
ncbi:2Fe-2S iron-sulfur cluster-binding protein [Paracoccus sp. IB05]|uniref:2Fe-2S iron-sulfur cluster-binding protein n=1 Tax=Paracoccus sp. IB05 TaxID=2779367 RepID=UPI0018E87C23|nr:2Fe-2S iron-sulfur cluster-binding protein [Paracoccus sp. IB05]MBJ2150200.1 (2Fe-2S)-binding protein [Paracoccus sp. IB05]